jgi:hypothetical protein
MAKQFKYFCMVNQEKAIMPCSGCSSPNGCLLKTMHYKESTTMNYDEKAIVKIESDGSVAKCAKGLAGNECGFKAGSKICGKCGAMAVQIKMVPVDDMEEDDEMMDDEDAMTEQQKMMMRRRKGMGMPVDPMEDDDMESMPEDEESPVGKMWGGKPYRKGMNMPVSEVMDDEEDMMDDEMMDEEEEKMAMAYEKMLRMRKGMHEGMDDEEEEVMATPKGYSPMKRGMAYKEDDEEMMEEDDEEEDIVPMRRPMNAQTPSMEDLRMARLRKMGTKSADVGINGYLCAIDRKVHPGSISVCDDCPGGCMAEKGLPGLLHIEGLAEMMFKGDVIDSGYSQEADMFVVDVQTKSGNVNEIFIDGTTAEVLGFHRLDDSVFEQKSLMDDIQLIDFNEASELAVKSVPGIVVAVEPSVFEGFDAYQVEIDGFDQKSYDVFVALDGEVLGWDKWEPEDTDQIEAEAAEIALKRAFPEDKRQEMAQEGTAMEDGSFPIASESDLRNAIMAHGRAKNVEAAKLHIMKQAKALGKEDMIPAEWISGGEKSLTVNGGPTDEFLKTLVEFELLSAEVDETGK